MSSGVRSNAGLGLHRCSPGTWVTELSRHIGDTAGTRRCPMPWSETSPMDQKTKFIADYLRHSLPFSELCPDYGISRKTGYKWIDRYLHDGPQGLEDRSHEAVHGTQSPAGAHCAGAHRIAQP